jgi:predicted transcriptional regulator
LLLLVNGQRSTNELARLMGRSLAEVETLLNDLERAGLIRQ